MADTNGSKTSFTGTYFDKDVVLRLSQWAGIAGWAVLAVYGINWLLSLLQFSAQFSSGLFYQKGMSVFDLVSIFTPYILQPLPGIVYFVGLQAVGKALLILMDIEDNLRRAARK